MKNIESYNYKELKEIQNKYKKGEKIPFDIDTIDEMINKIDLESPDQQKFIIHWLEMVNPSHACKKLNINQYEIDEIENSDNYANVLKEIRKGLPSNSEHTGEVMGDWEFECYATFYAPNIEKAKKIACEDYDCEVFVVFDKHMKKIFDDTDLEGGI